MSALRVDAEAGDFGDQRLAVTDGRTDQAEEEKEILEHRPNIMPLKVRSRPGRLLHPYTLSRSKSHGQGRSVAEADAARNC